MTITSNGKDLAQRFRTMADALLRGIADGMKKAAAAVDQAQVKRLRGSNKARAGTYPVPNRSGHLMGAHYFFLPSAITAVVGNSARYALSVHEGHGSSSEYGRRPFLDDAVEAADPAEILALAARRALRAL